MGPRERGGKPGIILKEKKNKQKEKQQGFIYIYLFFVDGVHRSRYKFIELKRQTARGDRRLTERADDNKVERRRRYNNNCVRKREREIFARSVLPRSRD